MLSIIALIVLAIAAVYLIALGLISVIAPRYAQKFLLGFATSTAKHFLEMALRLIVGAAMLIQAPNLPYPLAFRIFGWLLVGTTAVLIVIPWHWHRRFAEKTVPMMIRFLLVVGIVSTLLGSAILASLATVILR